MYRTFLILIVGMLSVGCQSDPVTNKPLTHSSGQDKVNASVKMGTPVMLRTRSKVPPTGIAAFNISPFAKAVFSGIPNSKILSVISPVF